MRDQLTARDSPFVEHNYHGGGFISDEDRVLLQTISFASERGEGARNRFVVKGLDEVIGEKPKFAVRAGPRRVIYYNPADIVAAIVTVGGLCPGLNDIVRAIVIKMIDYGVSEGNILGIRYGFKGFYDRCNKPIKLTRALVQDIQLDGGTMLGASRERADIPEIVKRLDLWKVDHLFVIGGTGGCAVAQAIYESCERNRVPTSVIVVPKSIDNDIMLFDRCFGFETAVEEAQKALMAAKVEALSGYRGIGIVKLMGRQSGFIAVQVCSA